MRFRTLLGLLAIGGAVAYARKRRGGDLSIDGFANRLRSMLDDIRAQIDSLTNKNATSVSRSSRTAPIASDVDHATDTGYASRSAATGYGSTDYRSTTGPQRPEPLDRHGQSNVGSSNIAPSADASRVSARDRNGKL